MVLNRAVSFKMSLPGKIIKIVNLIMVHIVRTIVLYKLFWSFYRRDAKIPVIKKKYILTFFID
jgi:hypothetical protein